MNFSTTNIYDVSNLLYAGTVSQFKNDYYGSKDTCKLGLPIGGIRKLLNLVFLALADNEQVLLVFDSPTKRKELDSTYKSARVKNPDILIQQQMLLDACARLKLPYLKMDGYEADDLVHNVCTLLKDEYASINIYSGDADLCANILNPGYTLKSTSSLYATVDIQNYSTYTTRQACVEYNSILAYFYFFGKQSNSVQTIKCSATPKEGYADYLAFCKERQYKQSSWSDISVMSQWLLHALDKGLIDITELDYLFTRMKLVYPEDIPGFSTDAFSFAHLKDLNRDAIKDMVTLYNLGRVPRLLNLDISATEDLSPELRIYMSRYKDAYQSGTFSVDNDTSPDNSFFVTESDFFVTDKEF